MLFSHIFSLYVSENCSTYGVYALENLYPNLLLVPDTRESVSESVPGSKIQRICICGRFQILDNQYTDNLTVKGSYGTTFLIWDTYRTHKMDILVGSLFLEHFQEVVKPVPESVSGLQICICWKSWVFSESDCP